MSNSNFKPGNTPDDAIKWINDQEKSITINVQSEITKQVRALSYKLQKELNDDIKGGPVAFTQKALFFNFIQNSNGTRTNQIIVRGDQAAYLRTVITDVKEIFDKFIPTQSAKLTAQGNITSLRNNMNKKFKVATIKGKKMLIDTTKKKKNRDKRIIAVREEKQRKMVFDFFQEAEDGAKLILSSINGTFTFTKRIT